MPELEQADAEAARPRSLDIKPEPGAQRFVEIDLWRTLTEATTTPAFAAAWLDLQATLIAGIRHGVAVLGKPERGPFSPQAFWPDSDSGSAQLSAVCEAAMAERRGVFRKGKKRITPDGALAPDIVALPLLVNRQLCGVVALEIEPRSSEAMSLVMRHLQWGMAWLEAHVRRENFASHEHVDDVLDVIATALEHAEFRASATAVATELSTLLRCDRVSFGFRRGAHTYVRALSHSAEFGSKSNLVRALGNAMDEAEDQHAIIVLPPLDSAAVQVTTAHAELARLHGATSICTVPLAEGEALVGGMTLERASGSAFSASEIALCEKVATLVGPILETKRRDDRWLLSKARDSAAELFAKLLGPRHVGLKLTAAGVIALAVFLSVAEGSYRVTADAALEGTVERAVTAPISGYIVNSHARAGDIVKAGQLMATLDDKELQLERVRWISQKEQRQREYSKALAEGDRAQVRILGAQIAQADAQLELLAGQLERIRILAPFDGIVVSGDLSQSLRAPVERGDILFEVAPLDSYRVGLKVDEREITQLAVGQTGQLALAAMTTAPLELTVAKITPVSTSEQGRNYFRVEATLNTASPLLRPGMEGVAKIDVDQRKLAWIYTHKMIQSLRMRLWGWWP